MSEQVRDLLSTRTVAIRFPDGDTEYWLTDQLFSVGQTIASKGRDWAVVDVLDPERGGHHAIAVREPEIESGAAA
jgi:hypothetical protein